MRATWVLFALAACGSERHNRPTTQDASPPADVVDAADPMWSETRPASAVVVGDQRVLWTQRHESCPLEAGDTCVEVGPTLSMRDAATGTVSTLFADRMGAESLVGDEDEVFMILGVGETDHEQRYVARFRPGISTAPEPMSATTTTNDDITALFVDSTYVYWRVTNSGKVYRASRTGNGSDATVLDLGGFVPSFVGNGYFWNGTRRVPLIGGPVEELSSIDVTYPIATSAGMYVAKEVDEATWSVGALGTDDVYRPVLASVPHVYRPYVLVVVDDDELFWTSLNQTVYRARVGDSTISTGPTRSSPFAPFAVTADEILYNFTRNGYDTAPR